MGQFEPREGCLIPKYEITSTRVVTVVTDDVAEAAILADKAFREKTESYEADKIIGQPFAISFHIKEIN